MQVAGGCFWFCAFDDACFEYNSTEVTRGVKCCFGNDVASCTDASSGIAWLFFASPLRESNTALTFVCLCYELCSLVGWGNIPFAIFSCAQRKANYQGATWWSYNEVKDLHGLCFWPLTCKWNIYLLLNLFTLNKFSPCKDLKQCKYCVPLGCGGQLI